MTGAWIYVMGERNGADIKIGHTTASTILPRLTQVNRDQMNGDSYVVLAGVVGSLKEETKLKRDFAHIRRPKGSRQEYFQPSSELVEWAAWLRSQYFVTPTGLDDRAEWVTVPPDVWMPGPGRTIPAPIPDSAKMVQDWDAIDCGPLAGTPWSWFPNPKASVQDYFTPVELVDAARRGMGVLDWDLAGHWLANRTLRIPNYFHIGFSAFDHPWRARGAWLNPPYGDNEPWWKRVVEFFDSGELEQICILSPAWAFTTKTAQALMERASASILLSPTPKFWGNSDAKTGSNHPHMIVYLGPRSAEVTAAFAPHGIPMILAPANREAPGV